MNTRDRSTAKVPRDRYIYRCSHVTMEGTCAVDHGPRIVDVGPLEADIYPVTNSDYAQFMAETGYAPRDPQNFLRHWRDGQMPPELSDRPVVWVAPEDAKAFAAWTGGRLPTDEEWQYIAAGPEGRRWPWGPDFDPTRCNHDGDKLTDVTAHRLGENWCGCQDLSGNAWEWTGAIRDDGMHQFCLIRGGSYFYARDVWHVAGGARPCDFHWKIQLMGQGMNRAGTVGFRCVYEAKP